jgi:hypothetical protein
VPDNQDKEPKSLGGESGSSEISSSPEIKSALGERGFFARKLELPKDRSHWVVTLLFILLAYSLSVWIRYTWIDFAEAQYVTKDGGTEFFRPQMVRNGVALPNTHDSFYFGTIIQKALHDRHQDNHLIPSVYENGAITYFPYLLLKTFPNSFTIEELLLKFPVWVAGLVCIPLVLIGRFYGSSLWGFFAACLAGVAHSYYNRTLAGYYDTDMLAITVPAFALCFLLAASRRESVGYLVAGAVTLYLGRFFYSSTTAITCAMCLAFMGYRLGVFTLEFLAERKKDPSASLLNVIPGIPSLRFTCLGIIFIGWALYAETWSSGKLIEANPYKFWFGLFLPALLWFAFKLKRDTKRSSSWKNLPKEAGDPEAIEGDNLQSSLPLISDKALASVTVLILALVCIGVPPSLNWGPFSGTWSKMTSKMQSYSSKRTAGATVSGTIGYNLHFKDVKSTIREASALDSEDKTKNDIRMRNRILEDLPLWRGEWSAEGSESPPLTDFKKKAKNYNWVNPFEKGYPKYKKDLALKTALLAFLGYFLLCLRYWEFCIGVPFWGIAYNCFSHFVDRPLGLRFTVHVGNVASIGLVFLLFVLVWALLRYLSSRVKPEKLGIKPFKYGSWGIVGALVCFFAWPNIEHAKGYYSHVVYPVNTIKVLDELNKASDPDDFVLTWWDYGSGCWFYGDARTFTSPAHQTFDNYLTSEILRSTSHVQGANLARVKTETFANIQKARVEGKSAAPTAVQGIFKDGSSDLVFYQGLLEDMKDANYSLPPKTREVFLFMPYEILRIFPTILSFSSRNLYFSTPTGKVRRDPPMIILRNGRRQGNSVVFDGGHRMDTKGVLLYAFSPDKMGPISYARFLEVNEDGQPAEKANGMEIEGLQIVAPSQGGVGRTLIFVRNSSDLVILSPEISRSDFAKRFFLEQFDWKVYQHPLFASAAAPRKDPFVGRAESVRFSSDRQKVILSVRGVAVEADLRTKTVKIRGSKEPVPFSFHRRRHDSQTGKMIKFPSSVSKNARYHLIETNLPAFRGQQNHVVPPQIQSLSDIAGKHGIKTKELRDHLIKEKVYNENEPPYRTGDRINLPNGQTHVVPPIKQSLAEVAALFKDRTDPPMTPEILSAYLGEDKGYEYSTGDRIDIPDKGYGLYSAFFFMDDEAFRSLLVQGFLMEELDPSIFEKVTSSAWGKVYKVLR